MLGGCEGDHVVLGHRLVDLGAPVVDRNQDCVRVGCGGQHCLGVGHKGGLGLLGADPSSSSNYKIISCKDTTTVPRVA